MIDRYGFRVYSLACAMLAACSGGTDANAPDGGSTSVNHGPVAVNDDLSTTRDQPLTIATSALLANDVDADGDVLTVTGVTAASAGHGTPVLDRSAIVFTPEAGFTGPATFAYTISDGTLTSTATVTIDVEPPAPTAVADAITVDEAADITINDARLLENDSDPDGRPLAIVGLTAPTSGPNQLPVASVSHHGTQITIHPLNTFYGAAMFSYHVSNGRRESAAQVSLTISPAMLKADLSVTMNTTATEIHPGGGDVVYTIFVSGITTHGVDLAIADALPPGLTCRWACRGHTVADTCTPSGSGDIADTVHISPDGDVGYALRCQLSASTTADSIANTVTLTPASWITDTALDNNRATITLPVVH